MNIDLHSHFFPVEALQNPGKYERHAPKLVLDKGKLSVTSQIGFRSGLGAGAYDPGARIKALDEMQNRHAGDFAVADFAFLLGRAGCGGALFAQAKRRRFRPSCKSIRIASSVSAACRCKAWLIPSPSRKRRRAWA